MRYIKIVRTPDGEAPEWVRRAWVGVTLHAHEKTFVDVTGVLTHKWMGKKSGYMVPTAHAIKVLQEKNPKAADWWKNNISFGPFFFNEKCARVVT